MAGFLKKILSVTSGKKGTKDKRAAYRVIIPNLRAKISGRPISISVKDISANGIALKTTAREFAPGNTVTVTLFRGSQMLLSDLKLKVVRVGKGFVGCTYVKPKAQQADMLHAITLEEQKREAEIKKKKQERAAKEETDAQKLELR
jgi:hypothetical protein